jgi:hypothetical protein
MNPYDPYPPENPPKLEDRLWTDGVRYFVFIPKNASSTVTDALKILRWTCQYDLPKRLHKPTPKEGIFFGVVRDPVQRWVSGIVQVFHRIGKINKRLREDISPFVEQPWYDQHQSPQAWYFREIENPRLYKIENLSAMWEWLEIPEPVSKNVSAQLRTKRELTERIWEQMTPEHEARLREFYKEDQALYDGAI